MENLVKQKIIFVDCKIPTPHPTSVNHFTLSFYLQTISILKKFLSSLTLITHAKPKLKDGESHRWWSPNPVLDPRPRRSDCTAQTHHWSDHAASASLLCSNPSMMNPTKPTSISPHPNPRPTASPSCLQAPLPVKVVSHLLHLCPLSHSSDPSFFHPHRRCLNFFFFLIVK